MSAVAGCAIGLDGLRALARVQRLPPRETAFLRTNTADEEIPGRLDGWRAILQPTDS